MTSPLRDDYRTSYGAPNSNERTWILAAHLSGPVLVLLTVGTLFFLGPLAVMLIEGKNNPRVRAEAVEALNFSLTALIAIFASGVLALLTLGLLAFVPAVVGLAYGIYGIYGAIKASQTGSFRYQATLRLVK